MSRCPDTPGFAKISHPTLGDVLRRRRLFHRLDQARNRPFVWVTGPAGSGKTALLSSYLQHLDNHPFVWLQLDSTDDDPATFYYYARAAFQRAMPGHRRSLPAFAAPYAEALEDFSRHFFEDFFRGLGPDSVFVLDDYHELKSESCIHEIVIQAVSRLSTHQNIVILSRDMPPPSFTRLRANQMLEIMDWPELRLTLDEFQEIMSMHGYRPHDVHNFKYIHEKMDGWAAGVQIVLERSKHAPVLNRFPDESSREDFFNYFAIEVFGDIGPDIQQFLRMTSILPVISVHTACRLTGQKDCLQVLQYLHCKNLFTEEVQGSEVVYRYHPLFREFLVSEATNNLGPDQMFRLKRKAAGLLIESGQYEYAANLLVDLEDWQALSGLLLACAPEVYSEGRHATLLSWLSPMPNEMIEGDPWLMYWLGLSLRFTEPAQGLSFLYRAFDVFHNAGNLSGSLHAWLGAVQCILDEWNDFRVLDPWIDWMESHADPLEQTQPDEFRLRLASVMLGALIMRRPFENVIEPWIERVHRFSSGVDEAEPIMQAYTHLLNYSLWQGDSKDAIDLINRIERLTQAGTIAPLLTITSNRLRAGYCLWHKADIDECLALVDESLRLAEDYSLHTYDHIFYALGTYCWTYQQNFEAAGEHLAMMGSILDGERKHGYCHHHFVSSWFHLVRENGQQALSSAEQALAVAEETGYTYPLALCHFAMSQVLYELDDPRSDAHLESFGEFARSTGSSFFRFMYLLSKAQRALDGKGNAEGYSCLREAFELGRKNDYGNLMWWWQSDVMCKLVVKSLEDGIEAAYARKLVKIHNLVPVRPPVEIHEWPWPLRIYTLGRFVIVRHGIPVRFEGKAKQKPVALLQALVSFGGRSVDESRLGDCLWPDADGDTQHQSLATTLFRLRRLMDVKDVIDFSSGQLTLNPRICWVDAWAFERLLTSAESSLESPMDDASLTETLKRTVDALRLYKGGYLPEKTHESSTLHMREKLRNRFLRVVQMAGGRLELLGRFREAVYCYQRALEVDPHIEYFYLRLMHCHRSMGFESEVISTYERCKSLLSSFLGVEPCAEMQNFVKPL